MGRYMVNDVKCGVADGGVACGPVSGAVNVSVNISDGEKNYWISSAEFEGIPNFYITDDDIFDGLMNPFENDEFIEFMNESFVDEFEGISLGEYQDIFESIKENSGNPAVALIRYMILLTRCSMEELDAFLNMAKGKYIDDLEIPASDVEEDWLMDEED